LRTVQVKSPRAGVLQLTFADSVLSIKHVDSTADGRMFAQAEGAAAPAAAAAAMAVESPGCLGYAAHAHVCISLQPYAADR
jgi:hypothetical protein